MTETPIPASNTLPRAGGSAGIVERALARRLRDLTGGEISLVTDRGETRLGRIPATSPLRARLEVQRRRFFRRLALGGSTGAAESFVDGDWRCDDLPSLLRILFRNGELLDGFDRGLASGRELLWRLGRALRGSSRQRSARNVAAHYDLGNDFFSLFLDPGMTYSAAVFERSDASLEEAQDAKYERICRKLALRADDHLLEIGTGWGGFAIHAARSRHCRVTSVTLSQAQLDLARRRVAEAGLAERVRLLRQDYRDLRGVYDKIASIEMIEAVGADELETFFRVCHERLAPGGAVALQAIVTPDQRYRASIRSRDFIKSHVFPDGQLHSVQAMLTASMRASDFRLVHLEELAPDYAETLRRWRRRFLDHRDRIRSLGYGERLLRTFDLYLASCEAAFQEGYVGLVQMVLGRPGWRLPRHPVDAAASDR